MDSARSGSRLDSGNLLSLMADTSSLCRFADQRRCCHDFTRCRTVRRDSSPRLRPVEAPQPSSFIGRVLGDRSEIAADRGFEGFWKFWKYRKFQNRFQIGSHFWSRRMRSDFFWRTNTAVKPLPMPSKPLSPPKWCLGLYFEVRYFWKFVFSKFKLILNFENGEIDFRSVLIFGVGE